MGYIGRSGNPSPRHEKDDKNSADSQEIRAKQDNNYSFRYHFSLSLYFSNQVSRRNLVATLCHFQPPRLRPVFVETGRDFQLFLTVLTANSITQTVAPILAVSS